MEVYAIYGITDCPACLRACALLMELEKEYVFVEMDFSKTYRNSLKSRLGWATFPIVTLVDEEDEKLIGGYTELWEKLQNRPKTPF